MTRYVVLFRGGVPAPEQAGEHMKKWGQWFSTTFPGQEVKGDPLHMTGKIVSGKRGTTVKEIAAKKDTVTGYIVIDAENYEQACEKVKKCPVFENKGKIEVREVMPMERM